MLTTSPEWLALEAHHHAIKEQRMRDWFFEDAKRFSRFSISLGDILFDYSKNRITTETITLLNNLAVCAGLPAKIRALFSAEVLNTTEARPALHMALRYPSDATITVNGENIIPLVHIALKQMDSLVHSIHQGKKRGVTGKIIRDIVNIGIGGSHVGPQLATHALAHYSISDLNFHFIADVDSSSLTETLHQIDPERTLFIVSSKSFTTIETLVNAKSCLGWLQSRLNVDESILLKEHFVAVTAKKEKAKEWGISEENIFPIWDWVGGRYSVWSAIGLPLALQIGMKQFREFLAGAYQADQHFLQAPLNQNIPVLMGLLSIWYINFFDASTHAIIPYDYTLKHLRAYLQQLDMESNGKRITHAGHEASYTIGAIIWGELGIHGQHAFHQLLHQGTHLVPVDFIVVGQKPNGGETQDLLVANALSQARALMHGKEAEEFCQGDSNHSAALSELAKHKAIPGNRPSNILFMKKISPYNLGSLLALYEHKVFVQSVIWNVNPFDQWGVELGKNILPSVLNAIQDEPVKSTHDSSTESLILHYRDIKANN